ncbi:hypothetical protein L195_g041147 [Trifolium pratense]|uniref:Cell wall protein n=1 Tax=Trifolium pratense TaxID=57577 RepID=A0A2K3M2S9_TRIPR|nr:hypothetical protein L195_g041147 [Trifolium pratense]
MAQRAYSFFAFLLIFNILLVTTWQAIAGRTIANDDKKEPEFLFKHEYGKKFHYPSIGHFGFPPKFGLTPNNPYSGGIGGGSGSGAGSGSTGRRYVPGNDDTFVPNPGYEVPIPGGGGRVASSVHP